MFFKSPQSVTEDKIREALSQVIDPDLGKDIVSLGFVKKIDIRGDRVAATIELTTPACPVKDQLREQCTRLIAALPGVQEVDVQMTAQVRHGKSSEPNRIALPGVKNVIAVASGKGGVGKSTVAIHLTAALAKLGAQVGILDADIYGPSLPLMMHVEQKPEVKGDRLLPIVKDGIKMMSIGFLISDDQPVVWRGPMVHGALTQFLTQVEWGELDYLIIDMPPGTGDAQLTISQNAPLSGAVIVTTPQEVSLIDARRGLKMFESVKVPILGVVENMSGFACPHCAGVSTIFRKGGGQKVADEVGVSLLSSIPIDPSLPEGGDSGTPIIFSHPESATSRAFLSLAQEVAARLSTLQMQEEGFRPLHLKW